MFANFCGFIPPHTASSLYVLHSTSTNSFFIFALCSKHLFTYLCISLFSLIWLSGFFLNAFCRHFASVRVRFVYNNNNAMIKNYLYHTSLYCSVLKQTNIRHSVIRLLSLTLANCFNMSMFDVRPLSFHQLAMSWEMSLFPFDDAKVWTIFYLTKKTTDFFLYFCYFVDLHQLLFCFRTF